MSREVECRAWDPRWMVYLVSLSSQPYDPSLRLHRLRCLGGPLLHSLACWARIRSSRYFLLLTALFNLNVAVSPNIIHLLHYVRTNRGWYVLTRVPGRLDQTFILLGRCWLCAHKNYTLRWIPRQRLTPHDIHRQPSVLFVLIAIVAILSIVSVSQIQAFTDDARATCLVKWFLVILICLIVGSLILRLHLQIHHYMLTLILIPGPDIRIRRSFLWQGFLVRLFINGIARWGWEPVREETTNP